MQKYSAFNLVRHAVRGNRRWPRAWRDIGPRKAYEVLIIGGGGHGLATAYYLAKNHGITDVAVLEKGWIGMGNVGRNTQIVRSDYLLEENGRFYEFSLKLWENLSQELNFNLMFSRRSTVYLAHSDDQLNHFARLGNAMRVRGVDAELWTTDEVRKAIPLLDCSAGTRYPVYGALVQPRAGVVRHDAVAWGYARAADALGVDIVQNCEVTGIEIKKGRVNRLETTRGPVVGEKAAIVVAGHTSQVAALAGLKLPVETHLLQAMVTESVKPMLDQVVLSGASHIYVSQTDKGEILMGGDLDHYPSYSQRGNLPRIEDVASSTLTLFPSFGRLRVLRTWAGIVDMTMDGSPLIDFTPVEGLYLNGGWNYGGFKAIPASGWAFAEMLATESRPALIDAYNLERFRIGKTLSEFGTGPMPQLQ